MLKGEDAYLFHRCVGMFDAPCASCFYDSSIPAPMTAAEVGCADMGVYNKLDRT